MGTITPQMREMLKEAVKEERLKKNEGTNRPLKRPNRGNKAHLTPVRRERQLKATKETHKKLEDEDYKVERYVIHIEDDEDSTNKQSKETENRINEKPILIKEDNDTKGDATQNDDVPPVDDDSEEDEDVDSDEFEDVDLDGDMNETFDYDMDDEDENGEINITIKQHRDAKKAKRKTVVDSEERVQRRTLHLMYLFTMVGHGVTRNAWLSDHRLLIQLQKQVPNSLKLELNQYLQHRVKSNVSTQSKTRKLLDFLRHLMEYWQKVWKINAHMPVLYKKTWDEIDPVTSCKKSKKKHKMTKQIFIASIISHVGSRDLAAQGFVALLRSLNLPARLVFSIQPPDFTNMKKCSEIKKDNQKGDIVDLTDESTTVTKPKSRAPRSNTKNKNSLLSMLRSKKAYSNAPIKTEAQEASEFSEKFGSWPVFWIELWDKDAKKYITIDPIVKRLIEVVNWKSKLEPPMNCIRNNAWYVVGYDRIGGVRDITRRYAKEYNAKVRKKRITREPKWEKWWDLLLKGACSAKRIGENRVDQFEKIEFEELSLKEGMPSNVGDFKGHPIYVLEADLKFNEVLIPKISCGGLSNKSHSNKASDGFIPVYKRSNVHIVRSPRGWFMRGRVLKMGERPLKIREKNIKKGKRGREDDFQLSDEDAGNNDDDGRLYAEYQTEKYVPPPVVDGIIPKNAFKNIDIYEDWMVPEGCVHIRDPYSQKAAKFMDIEYAPAVVGFDFKGSRRDVNAKIEGIVTLNDYKDAVELLCDGIREMEDEEKRRREDLINLRSWKILLTKLRINKRLADEHGGISSEDEVSDEETSASDEDSEAEGFEIGGFMPNVSSRTRTQTNVVDSGVDINERSDLSASDFDSDVPLDDGDDDMFKIKEVNVKKRKTKKQKTASSIFDKEKEDEVVYNPDEEVYDPGDNRYDNSSDEDGNEGASGGENGNDEARLEELDKEFAEFENGFENIATDTNNLSEEEEEKEEDIVYNPSKDGDDDDYEFEYSD